MGVLAATFNRVDQEGGSAAEAVLPLPPVVLPLGVQQQPEPAIEEKGNAIVPPRVVLLLTTTTLLSLEGPSYPEGQ